MSNWNEQGEECDCGSTTAHERSPGVCTPPRSIPVEMQARIEDAKRRIYEQDARLTDSPHRAGPMVGLDAMLPPLSPAAMLGEAVAHMAKARDLMESAGLEPMGGLMYDFNGIVQRIESRRDVYAKREAEAVDGQYGCPHCGAVFKEPGHVVEHVCPRPENARHFAVLKGPEEPK